MVKKNRSAWFRFLTNTATFHIRTFPFCDVLHDALQSKRGTRAIHVLSQWLGRIPAEGRGKCLVQEEVIRGGSSLAIAVCS